MNPGSPAPKAGALSWLGYGPLFKVFVREIKLFGVLVSLFLVRISREKKLEDCIRALGVDYVFGVSSVICRVIDELSFRLAPR